MQVWPSKGLSAYSATRSSVPGSPRGRFLQVFGFHLCPLLGLLLQSECCLMCLAAHATLLLLDSLEDLFSASEAARG